MELTTITQPKEQAEAAFKEYRAAFMAERNRIDGELMRGYKALKDGKQLIRLTETITAGGADERGRPRLAISRADERAIAYRRQTDGSVTFSPDHWRFSAADRVFDLPAGTLPETTWEEMDDGRQVEAMVPMIPPRFRPVHALSNYHILWEAVWTPRRRRRAPGDPALLKRIGGDLFAVLAVWDLTDLERAVLEMRG